MLDDEIKNSDVQAEDEVKPAEAAAENVPTTPKATAKWSNGVYIDQEEAEAYLESQRKKKVRNRIIATVVAVVAVALVIVILFNAIFGGNSGFLYWSDFNKHSEGLKPTGATVALTEGDTLFGTSNNEYGGKTELWYNPSETLLKVVVKDSTGAVLDTFRSWPEPTADEVDEATINSEYPHYKGGAAQNIISSLCIVTYTTTNLDGGKTFAIKQQETDHKEEVKTIENGFRIYYTINGKKTITDYDTPQDDGVSYSTVTVPFTIGFVLEVYLDNQGNLITNVPIEGLYEPDFQAKIAENDEDSDIQPRFASINVLPFFNASRQGDEGYYVTPDGSGALTYFNVARISNYDEYSKRIFGYDDTFDVFSYPDLNNQYSMMPVFASVKGTSMVTCFADEGKNYASIVMGNPGMKSLNIYYINYRFNWREFYTSKVSNAGETYTFLEVNTSAGDFKQKYVFKCSTDGTEFTYSDAAKLTQEYFLDKWQSYANADYISESDINKLKESTDSADLMNIKIFMADKNASSSKSFWGTMKVVTTFDQAKDILSSAKANVGSKISYTLLGWSKGGYYGNLTNKYSIESATGGASGLKKLTSYAEENSIKLSADMDLLLLYGNPKAGISFRNALLKNAGTEYLQYKLVAQSGVFYTDTYYYISPLYYNNKLLKKDIKFVNKYNFGGVALQQVGDMNITDYNKLNALSRNQLCEYYKQWIIAYREQVGSADVYYGYEYAAAFADRILDIPSESSSLFLLDQSIPFIQMVYHGVVDYYSKPLNREAHYTSALLKAIEFGEFPSFEVTYDTTENLKYTRYNGLYKAQYSYLESTISEAYKLAEQTIANVQNSTIVKHYCVDDARSGLVYATEYSNGAVIYVNYASEAYDNGTVKVPAHGVTFNNNGSVAEFVVKSAD